jgi:Bacterial transcriptional activator domain
VSCARVSADLDGHPGGGAGGSWDQAATEARAALALWRGEPLADAGSEILATREGPRLAELRLQAAVPPPSLPRPGCRSWAMVAEVLEDAAGNGDADADQDQAAE